LVTTLRVTVDGLELRGGTVRSEAPNHFAERLDHLLQPLGWRASIREVASSGSGWTFTLVASDPAVFKAPATTGGKKSAGPATLPANAASGVKR
jgi:hypothetical protein